MSHADEQQLAEQDEIGVPTTELARMGRAYWMEAAGSGSAERLRDFALDVADYLALLVLRDVPGGNWAVLYDEWLARATCHASQAACLAQGRVD